MRIMLHFLIDVSRKVHIANPGTPPTLSDQVSVAEVE